MWNNGALANTISYFDLVYWTSQDTVQNGGDIGRKNIVD